MEAPRRRGKRSRRTGAKESRRKRDTPEQREERKRRAKRLKIALCVGALLLAVVAIRESGLVSFHLYKSNETTRVSFRGRTTGGTLLELIRSSGVLESVGASGENGAGLRVYVWGHDASAIHQAVRQRLAAGRGSIHLRVERTGASGLEFLPLVKGGTDTYEIRADFSLNGPSGRLQGSLEGTIEHELMLYGIASYRDACDVHAAAVAKAVVGWIEDRGD